VNLTSFIVMDVLEKALEMERSGEKIVHMEVGEPDFPIAEVVLEAACKAIKDGKNSYSPSFGIPELREAIAQHYWERYKVNINPNRIFVTPGSSPALMAAIKMLSEDFGPRIAYTDPGYPCYKNMARFLSLQEVPVAIYEEDEFKLTPEHLNEGDVLILNSPANPTGTILDKKDLEGIVERAKSLNMGIISDEIYHGIEYEKKAPSILEITQDAVVINGFSKFFAATGWRLGWIIVPEEKIRLFQCIAQNLFICAPTPLQYAVVHCFSKDAIETYKGYVETYKMRRDYLIKVLKELGFSINYTPEGAFYVFAKVDRFTNDSFSFAMDALEKAKVAITPGKDFGENRTNLYVRFSYATSLEDIKLGMERLRSWLQR
jgi:aspartate/methionine/tyrosine aminotransferase